MQGNELVAVEEEEEEEEDLKFELPAHLNGRRWGGGFQRQQ
jgi:hypothetical protein